MRRFAVFRCLVPILLCCHSASAETPYHQRTQAKLEVVAKTQGMVLEKIEARESEIRERVRALYKLSRSSFPKLWLRPGTRQETARWLGAARRIAKRDISELALLRDELSLAELAEKRLEAQLDQSIPQPPAKASLLEPMARTKIVSSFGDYRFGKRLRLRRRGLELSAKKGRTVQASAPGTVRYVGPISGLGTSLVIDHGDFWVVLGHLQNVVPKLGNQIEQGSAIAEAAGSVIYFELRLATGGAGHAIDPTPYFK